MIQPLEDHILVEALKEESKTESGIYLSDNEKEKPCKGKVIATGQGKILDSGERWPIDVVVGDIVYFTKYAPDELEIDGKQYLIIKQSAILVKESIEI